MGCSLYAYPVLYRVTQLRDQGRRLPRPEWPAAVVGNLHIDYWPEQHGKRHVRRAALFELDFRGDWRQLLTPIFAPELFHMDAHCFVLRGFQIATQGRAISEHVQMWRCESISEAELSEDSRREWQGILTR